METSKKSYPLPRHCDGVSPKQSSVTCHCGLDPQSPCIQKEPHQARNDANGWYLDFLTSFAMTR